MSCIPKGLPGGAVVKNPPTNAGDAGLILAWEDPLDRKWQPTPIILPEEFHA